MRTFFLTLAAGIGLALSAWTAILKIGGLPCLGGGCEAVIQTSYGSLFGLPVGVYGAALWLGVFFAGGRRLRLACLGLLALGSIVFVCLQIFALKAFCPLCLAHALAAWIALALGGVPPRRWGGFAVLAAVAAALAVWGRPASENRAALAKLARDPADAVYWLGAGGPGSPVLVLSLICPACLDKLSALTRFDFSHRPQGPALYFQTDARQRDLTGIFVAAVLARPGDRREAFLAVAILVLEQKDLLLTDPENAAKTLRSLLPEAPPFEAEAAALLARQSRRLQSARIETTPLLIAPGGAATPFFKLDDLFTAPRAE